ncbi:prolyl-tRNA synthetase associated domain-containing protein [Paraburkholderia sp. Ac-20340]|uniref:YbaK/EbsC family protein n=1 Tax=Paraburkholderia sp. Ac-20340 TaxID=2703888 RepID=UPI0019825AA9|nr:YbaK/EbsC family protein [Paraburkholderia sp. Ac-20340]MBN3858164.1 prolyl-tRNA synthetase associated domain-containing protein [Paraburkholderia sp. Ac-20340]
MLNTADLLDLLNTCGDPVEVRAHDAVVSVEAFLALDLGLEGVICKNLLIRDKRGLYLLVVRATKSLDLKALAGALGTSRLSFADAAHLEHQLGTWSGALSPLALANDPDNQIELVIDAALRAERRVLFHPLDNAVTVSLTMQTLEHFCERIGHAARWVEVPERQR